MEPELLKTVPRSFPPRTTKIDVEVTVERSIAACARLSAAEGAGKVCLLNFASAKNPCGGMTGGSLSQEESIGKELLREREREMERERVRERERERDGERERERWRERERKKEMERERKISTD